MKIDKRKVNLWKINCDNSIIDMWYPIGYISHKKLSFGRWKKMFYKDASGSLVECFQRTK